MSNTQEEIKNESNEDSNTLNHLDIIYPEVCLETNDEQDKLKIKGGS